MCIMCICIGWNIGYVRGMNFARNLWKPLADELLAVLARRHDKSTTP
jgi:hypothetical protein